MENMFDIKNGELKIPVRTLVEFLCRSGNIDNRFGGISDAAAMAAGSQAHRRIQRAMGPDYKSEVPLKYTEECDCYNIVIEGRADGIYEEDGISCIDEIKGTYKELGYINEADPVHRAQAMCYGYFYAVNNSLPQIGIRITYVNLDDDKIKYFKEIISFEDIENWFSGIINQLKKWGDYLKDHKNARNNSIKTLSFPFEYRKKQRELAVSVYKTIEKNSRLFIQAPTGIGKTLSTIFPSVKAIGENLGEKIFYLTAKTITRTAAQETYGILRKNGLIFSTITITAKEKICFMEDELKTECNPIACPYAKGHFDRINDALYDIITNENVITRDKVEEYANKHKVCPFEFSLDISYFTDGIICDYNYVFDPHVYLKRFFGDTTGGEYIFLVDEAHNLVERARNMYSATIYKEQFLAAKNLLKGFKTRLIGAIERCNKDMLLMKRECGDNYRVLDSAEVFSLDMQRLETQLQNFMENNRDYIYMKELLEFYFDVSHYNEMAEMTDNGYVIYNEHDKDGFKICLYCVNPADNLAKRLEKARASIFFSATLIPVKYYKELLTGNTDERAVYAMSPFDSGKRLLFVGKDVTSRYLRRDITEFTKIKNYICSVAKAKKGNYMVFFPSYAYMESVYGLFKPGEANIIKQGQDMDETSKEDFLKSFESSRDGELIGFCVMGGVFSEGIDLKHDSLIGVLVVGTGLPSINTQGELLKSYYDEKHNSGYEYAYVYPGMNKVLQAAGRVIRTQDDVGVIGLLDDRFLTERYRALFPVEWNDYVVTTVDSVQQEVLAFWKN